MDCIVEKNMAACTCTAKRLRETGQVLPMRGVPQEHEAVARVASSRRKGKDIRQVVPEIHRGEPVDVPGDELIHRG